MPEEVHIGEERRQGFRFDKSISLGTVVIIITLLGASYMSVTRIINNIKDSQLKVNIMWQQFLIDRPEAARYLRGFSGE